MAFKLKHTNVQNMLGTGPKMYKEEGPAMYADKESAGPKAMDEMHNGKPGVQQEDFKQFSKGAKSMGPKRKGEPGVTDKNGKVIFTKKQREERKKNIVSPAEQRAIAAKNAARKASIKDRQ